MTRVPGSFRPHPSWDETGVRSAALVSLVWGAAFAVLELAYFTPVNQMYPIGPGHFLLGLVLTAEYALVAWGACALAFLTSRLRPVGAPASTVWAGPGALLVLLAVSHYRDRVVLHARRAGDIAITVAIVVGLVLVLGIVARWASARHAGASRRLLVAAGFALLAVGMAAFVAVSSPEDAPEPVEYVTAEQLGPLPDTGLRVLVVGLDGGDWKVLDPLLAEGGLPALQGLISRGVTARLESALPTFSPNLWTSVSTGMTLEKHGIPSHVFTKLPLGLPSVPHDPRRIRHLTKVMKFNVRAGYRVGLLRLGVYGSDNLKARQVWDIAGDFDVPTICLEWYVTHPAQPVSGIQVSDRFHLAAGSGLRSAVFPESLAADLERHIVTAAEVDEHLMKMIDVEGLDRAGRDELVARFRAVFTTLKGEMARDLTTQGLVQSVFPRVPDWRLAMVYYRAMDGSHHMSWKYRDLSGRDRERFPERRFRDLVDEYYSFCDELLARTLEQAGENTVVIALSDHGWENQLWGHARKPDGFFVMAGGPVIAAPERVEISVYDVAPTVLALLGIPVPEDMDGDVARDLVDPAFWREHPIRTVPSYGRAVTERAASSDGSGEERILKQLRALGYVGQ